MRMKVLDYGLLVVGAAVVLVAASATPAGATLLDLVQWWLLKR